MWRNYLVTGMRALLKDRTYAAINIFGLAFGLAACLILLVYIRYETHYDAWLPDSERIFQVQATWHEPGQPVSPNQASPFPVRDTIAGGFPQIDAVSVARPGRAVVERDGNPAYLDVLTVDPAFLQIFGLPFLKGDAASALPNVTSVVLTEREALRQFGSTDIVGRTMTMGSGENRTDMMVTGVLRDLPRNSHMEFGALLRFDPASYAAQVPEAYRSWGSMGQFHYVRLRPNADAAAINAALPAWERRVIPNEIVDGRTSSRADIMDLKLVNVRDIHLGEAQRAGMRPGNDRQTIATFAIVAALILAMACINFVNLSTARAGQRAREVALRKVVGASRGQLMLQFLGESILLSGIALLIALALAELSLPTISSLLEADLAIQYLGAGGLLPYILALGLLVGALGGLYPAFVLTRFQPATVLRSSRATEAPGGIRLRNSLVALQFAIAIGLMTSTWIIWSQTDFIQNVDPGYEREGLIQVPGAWRFETRGNWESARRNFAAIPGVVEVTRTNLGVAATNKTILAVATAGIPEALNIGVYATDLGFFETMGMRLLGGRTLGDRYAGDRIIRPAAGSDPAAPTVAPAQSGLNVVINRRAARLLGLGEPGSAVGREIRVGLDGGDMAPARVVGVVEDTRIRTARDEIEPLVFTYDPANVTQLLLRYRSAEPAQVLRATQAAWNQAFADVPFEGAFAEDLIAELYGQERARGGVFAAFAVLAIVIACLGLYGLAAFTAARRTKEIGIRKVLGATVRQIVQLLVWQFTRPVVIANLIAWPVAWWAMREWLNTFDIRIDMGPGPFVLAGLIAVGIAIGTIASHAVKVARANPIHALRYE